MIEEFMTRRVYVAFWVPNFLLQHGLGAGKRGHKLWLMFLGSHPGRQAWMQSLSLSHIQTVICTQLYFWIEKGDFLIVEFKKKFLPSFFPGKRWKHLFILDQLQALESTGGRESLITNKYTMGEGVWRKLLLIGLVKSAAELIAISGNARHLFCAAWTAEIIINVLMKWVSWHYFLEPLIRAHIHNGCDRSTSHSE